MSSDEPASPPQNARLGPVQLANGISTTNAATYLFTAFAGICLTTSISAILPYILNVNLGLPIAEQGRVSGNMGVIREIVLLLLSSLVGALSDRTGRRTLFAAGLIFLAVGYVAYGYVNSMASLITAMIVLAFGIALVNVMVVTIQVDYPEEKSRGKLVGFTGIAIGLGSMMIGLVILRLPSWYAAAGASDVLASRYTTLTLTGLAILTALIAMLGLKRGRPPHADSDSGLRKLIAQGADAARTNPRILLAYFCAFVSRGDLIVIGTFFNLWLMQTGLARGMTADAATRSAGLFFALVMLIALLWAPIMGVINDRIDRTTAMAGSLAIAAVGYSMLGVIPDPLGGWMYPAAALLGIGQMSVVSASQTLIGQESPKAMRGAVTGMFSLFGAAGILSVSFFGGQLFDSVGPTAPFVGVGIINGLLFLLALRVRAMNAKAAAETA